MSTLIHQKITIVKIGDKRYKVTEIIEELHDAMEVIDLTEEPSSTTNEMTHNRTTSPPYYQEPYNDA